MEHIFRFHAGINTIRGWDEIGNAYGSTAINSIVDPNGANCHMEITSIPSPFARIDLVKTAFKQVVNSGNLVGETIHHKMVSDCFDVGEIFFNIDRLRDKVELLVWDKEKHINELIESDNAGHVTVGNTFNLFLNQDAEAYNFSNLDRVYLLNYIGPGDSTKPMNIIGATSPSTIFFCSANSFPDVSNNIQFGNDKPFDGSYNPLKSREFKYQKLWYLYQKQIPDFATKFPEIDSYLELNFKELSFNQKQEIRELNVNDLSEYTLLTVDGHADNVEVLNFNLYKKKTGPTQIIDSDFILDARIGEHLSLPLALPVDTFNQKLKYTQDVWNRETKVLINDPAALNERVLPGDGTTYPYLTLGDFLEENIIRTPYAINHDCFFNGNDSKENAKDGFLLPIKRRYFDYFSIEDLQAVMPDRKNAFEIERNAGGVKAVLRIPIRGGYITYERRYFYNNENGINERNGGIIDKEFGFGIFPSIKFDSNLIANYRVILLDNESARSRNNKYSVACYRGNNAITDNPVICRNKNENNRLIDESKLDSITYVVRSNFDSIELEVNNVKGLLIPYFRQKSGVKKFTFAVDFGTTNTHIEYSLDGEEGSKALKMEHSERQILKLHQSGYSDAMIDGIFTSDFLPDIIGLGSNYYFPTRTVLSEGLNTNWLNPVFSIANTNIPFIYEKENIPDYNTITTDLKWSSEQNNQSRVRKYLENTFALLRNKVLLNNGSVSQTKIIWFYPASMTAGRFQNFKNIWEELYAEYFGSNTTNLITIPESAAPYYFYRNTQGARSNVVSIDIGGGTTDVLLVENGQPKFMTSFRYAANAIFGDGYGFNSKTNGFVQAFESKIMDILKSNNLDDLRRISKSLDNKPSTDIIAFYFSLAKNREILDKNIELNFENMLANDNKGKIIFIIFYASIIYHVANIIKAKGMSMPRHITFSGTGSKVLNSLTKSNTILEDFTKIIFEEIFEEKYNSDSLTIIRTPNPKEVTCKGGILEPISQNYSIIRELKATLLGTDNNTFVDSNLKYEDLKELNYDSVINEVKTFIDLVFKLNKRFSFYENFSANESDLEIARTVCMKDLKTFIMDGVKNKQTEIKQNGADSKVEESLFFYPLIGILNALARKLYI